MVYVYYYYCYHYYYYIIITIILYTWHTSDEVSYLTLPKRLVLLKSLVCDFCKRPPMRLVLSTWAGTPKLSWYLVVDVWVGQWHPTRSTVLDVTALRSWGVYIQSNTRNDERTFDSRCLRPSVRHAVNTYGWLGLGQSRVASVRLKVSKRRNTHITLVPTPPKPT